MEHGGLQMPSVLGWALQKLIRRWGGESRESKDPLIESIPGRNRRESFQRKRERQGREAR